MVQAYKTPQTTKVTEHTEDDRPEPVNEEQLDASTADILAEIDECIGELGEEFALQYRQQGGE